jgi:hypothetical protein
MVYMSVTAAFDMLIAETRDLDSAAGSVQGDRKLLVTSEDIEALIAAYQDWYARALGVLPQEFHEKFIDLFEGTTASTSTARGPLATSRSSSSTRCDKSSTVPLQRRGSSAFLRTSPRTALSAHARAPSALRRLAASRADGRASAIAYRSERVVALSACASSSSGPEVSLMPSARRTGRPRGDEFRALRQSL